MINITLDKLIKEKYDEIALNSILNNSNDYTTETLFNVYLLLRDREKNISPEKLKMLDEKFNNEGGIENYTKDYLKQKKEAIADVHKETPMYQVNDLIDVNNSDSSIADFSVIDYSNHRNIFWQKRYPVSKGLYTLTKILGWLVIIICTCAFLYVTTQVSSGGLGGIVLAYGVFAGILMLFISETILFQIDKSFFLYLDIHKKLTNL
jgi:hypothetical protein